MPQTRSHRERRRVQEAVWVEVQVTEDLRRWPTVDSGEPLGSQSPTKSLSASSSTSEFALPEVPPVPSRGLNGGAVSEMGDRGAEAGPANGRPSQRARFQYTSFRGTASTDPDEWLEDFVGTAKANGEENIKLTILAGVLRGEARPWYNGLPDRTKQDWDLFKTSFLKEFRPRGVSDKALIHIGAISMGKKESLRKFVQRFNGIIRKISTKPIDGM